MPYEPLTTPTKECVVCKELKPVIGKFHFDNRNGRYSTICHNCRADQCRKGMSIRRIVNPADQMARKKGQRLSQYGLTFHEYCNMIGEQGNKCKICNQPPPSNASEKERALNVDHCHKTSKVRGLLCSKCNIGLGAFKDDIDLLKKAIEYLAKHS